MGFDRDREYAGSTENIACAACNTSGLALRNALCAECEGVHWFCPECGRILDRDTDAVCTCGFALERLEERLLEIEREDARKQEERERRLREEARMWHRRFGVAFLGGGLLLVALGAAGVAASWGPWAQVALAAGAVSVVYGFVKRFHLGA